MGKTLRGLSKKDKKRFFSKKTNKKAWLYANTTRQNSVNQQTRKD